jgi:hypothetical protein
MSEKIELKDKLAAVDMNYKGLWDEIDDDQRKSLKNEFFILNRYISNVKTSNRDIQEHYVLAVNEYFNKHWYTLQKHPKLMWQLLCMTAHESQQIFYHEWIGFKKKKSPNKVQKLLEVLYPDKKIDEIELLAELTTISDAKKLAQDYGYDDKQITKILG